VRVFSSLAVLLFAVVAVYTWRARAEMAWRGPVQTIRGRLEPPRIEGRLWLLRPAEAPVTDPDACREQVLGQAAARGLTPAGPPVGFRRGRPPAPSLVHWRQHGRCALLLEQAPHAARLVDPALGEVVLLDRNLARWLERTALPLREASHP